MSHLCIHFGTIVARGSRTRSSNVRFRNTRFVLDIYCQQFREYLSAEYICWYWIYHAKSWGMNVSWTVSVRPSGAGMENIHFDIRIDMKSNSLEHCTQLEAFVSIVYIMPTIRENISWWNIYIDNGYILPTLGG